MVSGNDPVESFLNSVNQVKNAFGPLESGIRRVAKDFEHRLPCSKNGGNKFEFCVGEMNVDGDRKIEFAQFGDGDESKKGLTGPKLKVKTFLGIFLQNDWSNKHSNVDMVTEVVKGRANVNEAETCLQFPASWSLLINNIVQAPFGTSKKNLGKSVNECKDCQSLSTASKTRVLCGVKQKESKGQPVEEFQVEDLENKEGNNLSLECYIGTFFDQLAQNLQNFDLGAQKNDCNSCDSLPDTPPANQFHHKAITSILEGKQLDVRGFIGNLKFARVGGVPSSIIGVAGLENEEIDGGMSTNTGEETGGKSAQKLENGLLTIPLSNVERLRSTFSTVSFSGLVELVPYLGQSSKDHPDKKKLFSVQDFFKYTEAEGRRFFDELDRDGDGKVNLEDLEVAMRKRKLPQRYARDLMRRTRSHLFSKSFGWRRFLSLMEQKEPTILRAYTSLCLNKSGTLQKNEILASLKNAGLPANEDNVVAMMRFLNADSEESISYGHFRNFLLLLPSDRLQEDPRNVWFEAATVVAVAPPVEIPAGSVLKSAFAGGLSCAFSSFIMHPVDTIKTRVQASTLSFPEIIAKVPQYGARGIYRGSIPATLGQFSSHGLRTGIFEVSKLVLINVAPSLPDIQVHSAASLCSTVLGTVARIPCEVLKQRLQAGIFDNVGEALIGTWRQDGLKGFFRGTGATLCREIPFYVAGAGLYAESKKVFQKLLGRELEPWETILVGAISGGLASVTTTPFDVMKTRMMTAPQGRHVSMSMVAFSILRHEGPLGLFKGAVPRFFWVAPLGAMNFAGYELLRKAMDKPE